MPWKERTVRVTKPFANRLGRWREKKDKGKGKGKDNDEKDKVKKFLEKHSDPEGNQTSEKLHSLDAVPVEGQGETKKQGLEKAQALEGLLDKANKTTAIDSKAGFGAGKVDANLGEVFQEACTKLLMHIKRRSHMPMIANKSWAWVLKKANELSGTKGSRLVHGLCSYCRAYMLFLAARGYPQEEERDVMATFENIFSRLAKGKDLPYLRPGGRHRGLPRHEP